jgi:hypothetical protein
MSAFACCRCCADVLKTKQYRDAVRKSESSLAFSSIRKHTTALAFVGFCFERFIGIPRLIN